MSLDDHQCCCEKAGFCTLHAIIKGGREYQICKGENVSPSVRAKYVSSWKRQAIATKRAASGPAVHIPSRDTRHACKVGTRLKELLKWFGQNESKGCGCKKHSLQMDQRGCDWCKRNIKTILGWLSEEAAKREVVGFSLANVPGFGLAAEELVKKAIRDEERRVADSRTKASQFGKYQDLLLSPLVEPITEHIIYHVLPLGGNAEPIWKKHCDNLRRVRGNFSGKLIISLNTKTDDARHRGDDVKSWVWLTPEHVINYMADVPDVEYVVSENDSVLGEGPGFIKAMELLQPVSDSNTLIYYGHAKGVTRGDPRWGQASHWWSDVMWETMFENQQSVRMSLANAGICGPFRMQGRLPVGAGQGPHWFFSGTFFAFRAAEAFSRKWRVLPPYYGCVEQWPRVQFSLEQSACLFWDNTINLYDEPYWINHVKPALQKWREDHANIGICHLVKPRLEQSCTLQR